MAFLANLLAVGLKLDANTSSTLVETSAQGVSAVAAALAIYSRIVATKRLLVAPTPETPTAPKA